MMMGMTGLKKESNVLLDLPPSVNPKPSNTMLEYQTSILPGRPLPHPSLAVSMAVKAMVTTTHT